MSNQYINENEEIQQEVIANTSELIEETFSKPSLFDEQIDIDNIKILNVKTLQGTKNIIQKLRLLQSSKNGPIYDLFFQTCDELLKALQIHIDAFHTNKSFLIPNPLFCFTCTIFSKLHFDTFNRQFIIVNQTANQLISSLQTILTSNFQDIISISVNSPTSYNNVWSILLTIGNTTFPIFMIQYIQTNLVKTGENIEPFPTSYFSKNDIPLTLSNRILYPSLFDILISCYIRSSSGAFNCLESLPTPIIKSIELLLENNDNSIQFIQTCESFILIPNIPTKPNKNNLNYFKFAFANGFIQKSGSLYSPASVFYENLFQIQLQESYTYPFYPNKQVTISLNEYVMDLFSYLNTNLQNDSIVIQFVLGGGKYYHEIRRIMSLLLQNEGFKNMLQETLISSEIPEEKIRILLGNIDITTPASDTDFSFFVDTVDSSQQIQGNFIGKMASIYAQSNLDDLFFELKNQHFIGNPYTQTSPIGSQEKDIYSLIAKRTTIENAQNLLPMMINKIQDEPMISGECNALLENLQIGSLIATSSPYDLVEKGSLITYVQGIIINVVSKYASFPLLPEQINEITYYLTTNCMVCKNANSSPLKGIFDILYTIFDSTNFLNRTLITGKINKETSRLSDCAKILLYHYLEIKFILKESTIPDEINSMINILIDIIQKKDDPLLVISTGSQIEVNQEALQEGEKILFNKLVEFVVLTCIFAITPELKTYLCNVRLNRTVIEKVINIPYFVNTEVLKECIDYVIKPSDIMIRVERFEKFKKININLILELIKPEYKEFFDTNKINFNQQAKINNEARKNNIIIPNSMYPEWTWFGYKNFNYTSININDGIIGLFDNAMMQKYKKVYLLFVRLQRLNKFNNKFLNNAESLIYCITSFFSLKCNSLKDNVDLIMRKLGFEKVTTIDMLLEKLGLEEDEDDKPIVTQQKQIEEIVKKVTNKKQSTVKKSTGKIARTTRKKGGNKIKN